MNLFSSGWDGWEWKIYMRTLYLTTIQGNTTIRLYEKIKASVQEFWRYSVRKKKSQIIFFWYQVVHKRLIALVRKQNWNKDSSQVMMVLITPKDEDPKTSDSPTEESSKSFMEVVKKGPCESWEKLYSYIQSPPHCFLIADWNIFLASALLLPSSRATSVWVSFFMFFMVSRMIFLHLRVGDDSRWSFLVTCITNWALSFLLLLCSSAAL